MVQVKAGLARLSIAQIILVGRIPLMKLNGNPNFPNPPYPIHELDSELSHLEELERTFQGGSRFVKPQRDATLKSFISKMTLLTGYVNASANGDLDKLMSSGFELQKTRTPATAPTTVHKINCINMPDDGAVRVMWSGVKNRSYYIVQTTTTPSVESSWRRLEPCTAVHCEVYDLEVGKFAYFRVRAKNVAGLGHWSDVAKVMVA